MDFATRMSRLGTETAFEVLARAQALERKGRDVVHLEIGEPDFDTPKHIRDAAVQALNDGWTHYGPSAGLAEMREAVAQAVSRSRGIPVSAEEVVVTPGGKPILFFTLLALLDEGDEAIYPNPGFPIYESVIRFAGAKPVPLRLREESNWAFDPDELDRLITPRTKVLVLNSPHNPTGGVLSSAALDRVAAAARKHSFSILSDEIYSRLVYDGEARSIASYPGLKDRTIILDGFSKTYAMTGWRLGYGVMETPLAKHVARLMTNCNSCTATFVQRAGIAALQGSQAPVEAMVEEFRVRRDRLVAGLNELPGVSCRMPGGAFYAFPNITGTGMTSQQMADGLLDEAGVAVLSGTAFGSFGEGYLRLSCANSLAKLETALERMHEFLTVRVRA
ncbi:MAG TPA: pyridoxal phosphate-dependent aminotransferase [Candidatus Eisenbacteria bacterium]|nr:pyridoxal phosphate-dependent aminotransferase [Candidatus Eisenbacteria bacterium]